MGNEQPNPKRPLVEKFILDSIQSLTPNSTANRDLYAERFKRMDDTEFAQFMKRLETGEEVLMIVSPNHSGDGLSIKNNLAVADKIGHDFFTRVLTVGQEGVPDHLSPIKFMVVDLPIRRLSQTSDKKIRVPKSSKVIDALTGQVTGASKGAAMSAPEVQVMAAMGLEASLIETLKYRGGDRQGRHAATAYIAKFGSANLSTLERYASGVVSTNTLRTFLTSAHLRNNL